MGLFDLLEGGLPPIDPSITSDWDPNNKVIVIGAGAAGLYAAYTLKYLNVPFIILEASKRHGGRVQRDDDFLGNGVSLDIGAEWIHSEPSVLKELILVEDDRKEVETFIKEETIVFDPQTFGYYNSCLGDLRRFDSLKHLYKEHKFKTKTWSQYLEKYLFSYVKDKIEYEAIVKEIDYSSPDSTKVILTNGKEYSATKVICAVPLSILKNKDIQFTPELPKAKQDALDKNKMKPGLKVAIEFKKNFYLDCSYDQSFFASMFWLIYGVGAERGFFDALINKDIPDKHVLGLYCYGALAEDLSKLEDDEIFNIVMEKLDVMYDGQASENYMKHIVKNWTKEPFILGASSNVWYQKLMEKQFGKAPLQNRVFFAGELVSADLGPTVHGACVTGRRAALNAIGK